MTTTPVPPPLMNRRRPAAEDLDHGVRPLPPIEPAPGPRCDESASGRTWRPARDPGDSEPAVPVPTRRAAHALILMALEVVDRKRAPQHTRGAFPPHLTEMLRTLAREGVPGRQLGPARIHRLHIHAADPGAPRDVAPTADRGDDYEVCATYARGPRLFAVAARIRVTPTGATCTALRLA